MYVKYLGNSSKESTVTKLIERKRLKLQESCFYTQQLSTSAYEVYVLFLSDFMPSPCKLDRCSSGMI